MKNKILLISSTIISFHLTGCSTIGRLSGQTAPEVETPYVPSYNFIQPRRLDVPSNLLPKLDTTNSSSNKFRYFSASGHICQTLSIVPLKTACQVGAEWKSAAPILTGKPN